MTEQLSPFKIKYGRRIFDFYSAINSFSFALVTGNTITLYALSLGASSTAVGLLSAFMSLSFFAIPIGKILLKRTSLVRTFAHSWMLRNSSLIPLLIIPWLSVAFGIEQAIFVLILCVFLFNFFRGIGLIANNPIIGALAPGKDRGSYIVRISLINNATALLATIGLAFLLKFDSGIQTYNLVILIGIITGIFASLLLYRLPEPVKSKEKTQSSSNGGFVTRVKEAFTDANFRKFLLSYLIVGLGMGMARPFIIVFCKEVYTLTDSVVTVFTICSSLGAILMGLIMRLVIDRLGAKPMFVIFSGLGLVSLILVFIAPGIGFASFSVVFLSIISAVTNMGFAGQENAAQTYFFGMVKKDDVLDLSMLYYFILGGTGAIGAIVGGFVLDGFTDLGLSNLASFRLFFTFAMALIGLGIFLARTLQDQGSYAVKDTLAVLFSPRDMRALTLLRRLDENEDPEDEPDLIAELGEVGSLVSAESLLSRFSSPRSAVRYEAFQSVASLQKLSPPLREALIHELLAGEYATASICARTLGYFRVQQAIVPLNESLKSSDYRLVGEAMLALARIGDTHAQFTIGDLLLTTKNPFIMIRGIQAMEVYATTASVPLLIDFLRNDAFPEHIADEAILSLSTLMNVSKKFFYAYERYVKDRSQGVSILVDLLDEYFSKHKKQNPSLVALLKDFMQDQKGDSALVDFLMNFSKGRMGVFSALLVGTAVDSGLNSIEPFRFFLAFWIASAYVNPSLIEK